jgi:2-polyprenyl-3-methyl-5-hydroxy-6-metoxy-1,4-benzoquinol methylase
MTLNACCPICDGVGHTIPRRASYGETRFFKCKGCRAEFLSPQPTDDRLTLIYSADYYRSWAWETPEVIRTMKARTFRRALKFVEPQNGMRLLDVGCAQGEFAESLSDLDVKVAGVDLNEHAIAIARERVPEATFFVGELRPEIVGWGWDLLTMFDFIEHVRDPLETIATAAELLKPGGKLLISTPRTGSAVHHLMAGHWPQYREEHLVLFSEAAMRRALERAGLQVNRIVPTVKYVSPAYIWGQASQYSPRIVQEIARRSKVLLRFSPTHWMVPLLFGEMTVVAQRVSE